MKLITETLENVKILVEENNGKKRYFIEGIFMQGDITNRNRRQYPTHILARECKRYTDNFIKENRAYGELNHPPSPTINLDRVSHMITSLEQDGSNFIGKAKILETPMGKIAQSLLDEGARLAVSSRGVGNLEECNGYMQVKEDFFLATPADIVADPSAPQAFVRGIMEGAEWVYLDGQGWIQQHNEAVKKAIDNSPRGEDREKVMIEAFESFLNKLSKHYSE